VRRTERRGSRGFGEECTRAVEKSTIAPERAGAATAPILAIIRAEFFFRMNKPWPDRRFFPRHPEKRSISI